MDASEMKKCPYCAEMIKAEAIKCRYCGSMISRQTEPARQSSAAVYWQRVNRGKKIAGVCTGLARQFESPVLILPLRVLFGVTTLFYGFGVVLYVALWLLMPPPADSTDEKQAEPVTVPNYAPPQAGGFGQPAPPMVSNYPGRGGPAAPEAQRPSSADENGKETDAGKLRENESDTGFDLGGGGRERSEKDKP